MVKYPGGALLPTLQFDRNSRTPISAQLCTALREMILSGELQPGERLPSSRTLAKDHEVSRTTAISVYEQLAAEGLIRSSIGAGAYVADTLRDGRPARIPPKGMEDEIRSPPRLAQLSADASEHYFPRLAHPENPRPFITGIPAFDEFPMALWASMVARYWRQPRNLLLGYPPAEGLMELRRAVAMHLRANRGITCEPEQVFIFNGAQDAFNRIGNTLLDPGDTVWIENPGAIGARNSLISSGAKLVPLSIDEEGINVAEGLAVAPDFRLAFVTPAHQHPLGVTMSLQRRFELLRAAERAGAWIIEDDYVGEFHYAGHPPPTLKSVDTSGRVIYVGSFSKALFAALRLGYVVAPSGLVDVFYRIAGATLQGSAASLQSVVASFIECGHFSSHIRRMRRIYAERLQALLDGAAQHMQGMMEVAPTETGFHTVGRLAEDFDELAVARRAAERNILVSPISRFAITPVTQRGLILGFSSAPPRMIASAAETLGAVLKDIRKEQARRTG
ncbi:PLP-dependent aminotransferase family protein [Shinella kummerowiae]|uniref:MocR-like pyridoxine biosynthesis transcription factor PdxR n=1 Tax=Shinella kummerowiae TaxID=417745 RepID=UPI0021B61536|nr:PLP-dependent aminotransferase family protein [Shinella kummerowiae]MCT7666980.1 PLP-dependent aminotransferase family protein [Shinella kummerowiae]